MSQPQHNQPPPIQPQAPHRDAVNNAQINNLLIIAQTMMPMMLNPLRDQEVLPGSTNPPGNARDSAEATFIQVCSRLDDLINDASRWSMEPQNKIEMLIEQINIENMRFLRANTAAAEELTTPHFKFRPILARLPTGDWAAVLGDGTNLETALIGLGTTPAEAVRAFDALFNGQIPEQIKSWLVKHEAAIQAGQVSPPYPINIKNETRTLDSRKRGRSSRNAKGGGNPS